MFGATRGILSTSGGPSALEPWVHWSRVKTGQTGSPYLRTVLVHTKAQYTPPPPPLRPALHSDVWSAAGQGRAL